MKALAFAFAVILPALLGSGCATTTEQARPATGTPDHFLTGRHDDTTATEPDGGTTCRNPLVDPRDGTRLILVRASDGIGDYEVPEGRYGVGRGEVLRVECATGRTIGIFPER